MTQSAVRTNAAALADAMQPTWVPEHTPSYTLDRHIAEAKRCMGPERWAELNREWEAKP